jgi:hypothetical protein
MDVPKTLAGALAVNRAAFGLNYLLRPEQARASWIGRAARKRRPPASASGTITPARVRLCRPERRKGRADGLERHRPSP